MRGLQHRFTLNVSANPGLLRTGREHDAWWGLALGLAVILSPVAAKADGLPVRTKQTQGPFIITVFAPPEASRDLPSDVMVMIQRRDSGEVVMDAAVDLSFVPPAGAKPKPNDVLCGPTQNLPSPKPTGAPHRPASIRAPRAQVANKLFYGTSVVLRAAGLWQLRVTIRQGGEDASVTCTLPVGIRSHRLRGLWPYLALPPAVIVLFAMNQWLRRRSAYAVHYPSGIQILAARAGEQPEHLQRCRQRQIPALHVPGRHENRAHT
jgi:hypothetical protein